MYLLTTAALPQLEQYRTPNLGRLCTPRHFPRLHDTLQAGFKVGVDNDCFNGLSDEQFFRMVWAVRAAARPTTPTIASIVSSWLPAIGHRRDERIAAPGPVHPGLLWVAVPDVPFDAAATARRWAQYAWLMSDLPLALCVQDGAGDVGIPWDWPNLRCLFLAGSTEYKLSAEMAEIAAEARRRRLWVHMGRVNSAKRIKYAASIGCDSIDGTASSKWRATHLPRLRDAAALPAQTRLTV